VPTVIKAKKDEPVMSVIRRFKKQVAQDQVLKEARKRDFFRKPSEMKKEKRKEWERQKRRNQRIIFA
jgi:small subunit ribosomal protein S21